MVLLCDISALLLRPITSRHALQGTLREHSVKIQGTFEERTIKNVAYLIALVDYLPALAVPRDR